MLNRIKEINYFFVYQNIIRRIYVLRKISLVDINIYFNKLFYIDNFFVFKNKVDLLNQRVFKYYLYFWLFFKQFKFLKYYKSRFSRGIRYYSFFVYNKIFFENVFDFFDFFIEQIFINIDKSKKKFLCDKNKIFFYLKDLDILANLRLSNSVYMFFFKDLSIFNLILNKKFYMKLIKFDSKFNFVRILKDFKLL